MIAPHSRLRGLIRDLTDGLAQQMYLWGRDVRHPDGNALVRAGLQRIARIDNDGEGTSLYRIEREGGWIELHGFCAGWRPHNAATDGMLYVRRCHRIFIASGQMIPGRYDMSRLRGGTVERVEVQVGLRDAVSERLEITTGIAGGDTVLLGAARGISVGTAVSVSAPVMPGPAIRPPPRRT